MCSSLCSGGRECGDSGRERGKNLKKKSFSIQFEIVTDFMIDSPVVPAAVVHGASTAVVLLAAAEAKEREQRPTRRRGNILKTESHRVPPRGRQIPT